MNFPNVRSLGNIAQAPLKLIFDMRFHKNLSAIFNIRTFTGPHIEWSFWTRNGDVRCSSVLHSHKTGELFYQFLGYISASE